MAVRCSPSPAFIIQKPSSVKKPVSRVLMLAQAHVSVKSTTILQITSSFKNKVYEDQSEGIICYKDDSGEIVCEGYDEGPHLRQQFSILAYNTRDSDISDLQRCWLQIVDSNKLNHADEDVVGQKNLNPKESNSFC
ncbi:unnamed protein product [Ilex paraguariensis]|uniref:Uncharacterized protein n=1 Tax=Ilex paraguariensis TaxID=185542 RepID=A0ABC8RI82_9AQUA